MIRVVSSALSVGAEGAVFYFMRCFTFFEKIRLYLTKKVKYKYINREKSKVRDMRGVMPILRRSVLTSLDRLRRFLQCKHIVAVGLRGFLLLAAAVKILVDL